MSEIAKLPARRADADIRPVLVPTNFDQLVRFSEMAAVSGMVPRGYDGKPAAIMIAVQMGSELGMAPMQALSSIAVINGRPGIWGDGLIGLCRASPLCDDIVETIEGEGDARQAVCVATRVGKKPVTGKFSVADAKKAGLWGKQGPWQQYPDRMLTNRARGFALRDAFPDVLRGLKTAEELRDTPPDRFVTEVIEVQSEPAGTREAINAEVALKPKQDTQPRTPIDYLAAKIANCTSAADVVKASQNWHTSLAKATADKKPLPSAEMQAQAVDMLRRAAERFNETARDAEFAVHDDEAA